MKDTETSIKQGVVSFDSKDIPSYGWYKKGKDLYLNLGIIKKAVIIREKLTPSLKSRYFVSVGSYFPFTTKIYDKSFETMLDAQKEANQFIGEWLKETYQEII